MSLSSGARLGPYEIVAPLGVGGMGEVYRATDTNLGRQVAIKILPEPFAQDVDRLARFEREARLLATLNHPNIAQIYGVEETDGVRALVMELVEGPTLADRIAQGPIPVDEALPIAKQIAEALEAAHEQGIIHRDLKPANIKLRPDATVKVLDFGLAKAIEPTAAASPAGLSMSPTITSPTMMTGAGMILGTAAYMSPEQARGKPVDKRADIWAFGCVLYEMLTGRRAFDEEDVSMTLSRVLQREPELEALPASLLPRVRQVIALCLRKDPKQRISDVHDIRLAMDGAFETGQSTPSKPWLWPRPIPALIGVLAISVLGVLGVWRYSLPSIPDTRAVGRFQIEPPDGSSLGGTGRGNFLAVSPDGRNLVYVTVSGLYLRPMDRLTSTLLPGTETPSHPFFSPDGRWIGFFSGAHLKKVLHSGGNPLTVAEVGDNSYRGATWATDNTIIFGSFAGGLRRVAASEGSPEMLTDLEAGEVAHRWPEMLPGGNALLFTVTRRSAVLDLEDSRIAVLSLETGERRILLDEEGYNARYAPTGHIVYIRAGTMMTVPFDLERLAITGNPVPIVDGIQVRAAGAADFAFASDGSLAYISEDISTLRARTLVWVDRQGREDPIRATPRTYRYPRLSPDGTRVALDIRDEQLDIWILHLVGETLTRLTLDEANEQYVAWADNSRVLFASQRSSVLPSLFWQAADGTGSADRLVESETAQNPMSVSPDGTRLVFREDRAGNADLMTLSLQGEHTVQPLVQTPFQEVNAEISPDGRWIAYQSNESGRFEIYVRPFPNVNDARWQVSSSGGSRPVWAQGGRELFYVTLEGASLMSVPVKGGPTFQSGTAAKLLDTRAYYFPPTVSAVSGDPGRTYDVSRDGSRFLMIKRGTVGDEAAGPQSITVVVNWLEELRQLVPTR